MLGDWDLDAYEAVTISIDKETGEFVETPSPARKNAAIFFFILYTFIITVVLMNLLIAIMVSELSLHSLLTSFCRFSFATNMRNQTSQGDSYDRVRENQELEGRLEKARVLCDIDRTWYWLIKLLGKKAVARCYPRCLHVLVPKERVSGAGEGGADEWEGRVKAIARKVDACTASQQAMRDDVEAKLDQMQEELRKEVQSQLATMRAGQKEVLDMLRKLVGETGSEKKEEK